MSGVCVASWAGSPARLVAPNKKQNFAVAQKIGACGG